MRLELIRVGLLVELANHYTTRGASGHPYSATTKWTIRFNVNTENAITNLSINFLDEALSLLFIFDKYFFHLVSVAFIAILISLSELLDLMLLINKQDGCVVVIEEAKNVIFIACIRTPF